MSNWKNVNNWHWVNKNCIKWAEEYFTEKAKSLEAEISGNKAKIVNLTECNGDVELNQRKGKIITIFDVNLKYSWEGTASDGTEATGTIEIPEVAHDTEEDEYVFNVSVTDESDSKDPVKNVVKKGLAPLLRKVFSNFAADLIKAHGSDVYIEQSKLGEAAPLRPAVPINKEETTGTQNNITKSTTESEDKKSPAKVINTADVDITSEFQTSAEELYKTILDPERVNIWTRGSSRFNGDKFEFFGGNVTGEVVDKVLNKKIVQRWRLGSWPKDHYSTVTFVFDQHSDCVKLQMHQTGVPIGKEEETKSNWDTYYWRAIKQSFGFGVSF